MTEMKHSLVALLLLAAVACGPGAGDTAGQSPQGTASPEEEAAATATATVDLAEGEELAVVGGGFIDPSTSGFAVKGGDFTSPGPTIRGAGDTVTTISTTGCGGGSWWRARLRGYQDGIAMSLGASPGLVLERHQSWRY